MTKDIIIAGAGIAGLSAGCYARMNGFSTGIFEMHNLPGGLCTAWERKGYKWDISMHMLTGSVSGPFHKMWKELGVTDKFSFHFHEYVGQVRGREKELNYTTDREKLEQEMLAISPGDEKRVKEFISLIFGPDMMKAASLKPRKLRNIGDTLKMLVAILPLIRIFGKYKRETIQQFTAKFKDPFLGEAVRFFIDSPGWPMIDFPMVALSGLIRSGITEAGVPIGGSQQVVFHMEELYRQLGGEIQYKSRVTDLVVENDRVIGIELEDGSRHFADEVIWAGDGHSLISGILEGKYLDQRIGDMYEKWIPVKPVIHVMIGVDMDLTNEPHRILFEAEEAVRIAGRENRWLSVIHHCFDPSMAPPGKSAVEVWYDTEYDYWEELARDRKKYKAEKKRIADYSIRQLENIWPGFAEKVEVVDVPTPATYHRYTGNWKGSPDGWYITADNMNAQEPLRCLPGLKGLSMIGQWTAPFTGTVIAALTGRQSIQLLCREKKKRFLSEA